MATRKSIAIAARIGKDPEQVQAVLARVNPSTRAQWVYCADQLGCDVNHLQNEAAKAAPEPLMPRNWTPTPGTSMAPYHLPEGGIASTPYAGALGGYTWGPVIPSRPDGT